MFQDRRICHFQGAVVLTHVRINQAISGLAVIVREEAAEVCPLLWTSCILGDSVLSIHDYLSISGWRLSWWMAISSGHCGTILVCYSVSNYFSVRRVRERSWVQGCFGSSRGLLISDKGRSKLIGSEPIYVTHFCTKQKALHWALILEYPFHCSCNLRCYCWGSIMIDPAWKDEVQ